MPVGGAEIGPGGDGFDDLDDVLVMLVGEQGRFDGLLACDELAMLLVDGAGVLPIST